MALIAQSLKIKHTFFGLSLRLKSNDHSKSVMCEALFERLLSSLIIIYSFPKTKGRSKSVMREALAQGSQTLRLKVGPGMA